MLEMCYLIAALISARGRASALDQNHSPEKNLRACRFKPMALTQGTLQAVLAVRRVAVFQRLAHGADQQASGRRNL